MAHDQFSPLDVRQIGERRWLLLDDLIFTCDIGIFIAPRGFQTDLASIPRLGWTLFPPIGWYNQAAVIHDAGYGNALLNRRRAPIFTAKPFIDELFLKGMEAMNVHWLVRRTMYRAVVLFGDPLGHPLAHARPSRLTSVPDGHHA